MVRPLIFLFLLSPLFLFSGEFIASVSQNQVNAGESFTLNLTLKDASAKVAPSLDSLKKSFVIHSQQQSFNTRMINGQISSQTNWKLTLIPLQEGKVTIPSITLETAAGILSTEAIEIHVVQGNKGESSGLSEMAGMSLAVSVDNPKPYKNEPIFYTIKLSSKHHLANLQMQKIQLEDAILEAHGQPEIYEQVIDGVKIGVVEIQYLITPLKPGLLKIPSVTLQGETPVKRKIEKRSFFDDDLDPFSMLGFESRKPFALTTEEIVLDVQDSIPAISPWLPAQSLKIEEVWDGSQSLQVGEPFNRTIKILAEGIKSSQLPSLKELQIEDRTFKIYADKPEIGEEIKEGVIKSYRQEHYTLIPQQAGEFTLPEISLAWWDTQKKQRVVTHIPSRTVQVLPSPQEAFKNEVSLISNSESTIPESNDTSMIMPQRNGLIFYVLIGLLLILLFVVITWAMLLQRQILRLKEGVINLKKANQNESFSHFNGCETKLKEQDKNRRLPDLNPT